MRFSQSLVAKQYAKAYILEFGSTLVLSDIDGIKHVINFCRKHHTFMSLVSALTPQNGKRHSLIDDVFQHFKLPDSLKKLVDIMIGHKRLPLFALVLQDIYCLFLKNNNILEVAIHSAVDLDNIEQKKLEDFFMKQSGKKIISNVIVDDALIAGVRMQSDLFLWEYSIAARIRKLSRNIDLTDYKQ